MWEFSPRNSGWAALGGLVAAILIGIPLSASGLLMLPAKIVGSDSTAVAWGLHLLAGIVFGFVYALVATPMGYGHGAWTGAVYGLVIGVVFVLVILDLLVEGRVLMDARGAAQVGWHVLWGILVGLVTAFGARREAPMARTRRRTQAT